MERIDITNKLKIFSQKYKFPIIVLLVGIVLILIAPSNNTNAENPVILEKQTNILSVEEQLTTILSNVKGAGKVQVMLSIVKGEETFYQINQDNTSSGDKTSVNIDTVTVTNSDRNETGLIRQVNPPVYSGAVVVCEGADNPNVKLAVMDAVAKLTGLGTDKIAVLKMK